MCSRQRRFAATKACTMTCDPSTGAMEGCRDCSSTVPSEHRARATRATVQDGSQGGHWLVIDVSQIKQINRRTIALLAGPIRPGGELCQL